MEEKGQRSAGRPQGKISASVPALFKLEGSQDQDREPHSVRGGKKNSLQSSKKQPAFTKDLDVLGRRPPWHIFSTKRSRKAMPPLSRWGSAIVNARAEIGKKTYLGKTKLFRLGRVWRFSRNFSRYRRTSCTSAEKSPSIASEDRSR